jgi:hypothetical protein
VAVEISLALRQLVARRANNRCEYCLIPEVFTLHKHEPDHIIPIQHGGQTTEKNLALACMRCNRHKGSNVGSFDPDSGVLVPFYNPRNQHWMDHFKLENGKIYPLSPEARVTVKILNINDESRIVERQRLIGLGVYLMGDDQ